MHHPPRLSGPPEERIQSTEEESHVAESSCPFVLDGHLSCDRINRIVLATASHAIASSFGKWLLATYADRAIVRRWWISSHRYLPGDSSSMQGGGQGGGASAGRPRREARLLPLLVVQDLVDHDGRTQDGHVILSVCYLDAVCIRPRPYRLRDPGYTLTGASELVVM